MMRLPWFSAAFGAIIGLCLACSAGHAAEVTSTQSAYCRFVLKGEIMPGDLAKLEAIQNANQMIKSVDPATGDSDARLCLDSTGGNFIEGVKIAKFVSENGWGTVVDEGETCLSACAIVFMAGRVKGPEEDGYNRRLHIRGKLGFHRPLMPLPGSGSESYSASEVQAAFDAAIDSVVVFLSMGNQVGSFSNTRRVRMSLLEEMMRHKGNNFFYIDTVDKAGRWEIEVFGYQLPKPYTEANIYNACSNFIAWANDESNEDGYSGPQRRDLPQTEIRRGGSSSLIKSQNIAASYETSPAKSGLAEVTCEIHVYNAEPGYSGLTGCFRDGFTGLQYGQCAGKIDDSDTWISPIAVFDPQTRLTDLTALQPQLSGGGPRSAIDIRAGLYSFDNTDLSGDVLRSIKGETSEGCLDACKRESYCVGATYDKWNRLCFLKRQVTGSTVSAKATSWALPSLRIVQPNPMNVDIVKRRDRRFHDASYLNVLDRSYEDCATRCSQDSYCIAFNFRSTGYCELIANASEYMPSQGDIAGYKSGPARSSDFSSYGSSNEPE